MKSHTAAFYEDLVEAFFKTSWLQFHCCVVERATVRKEFHQGDYDLARRKHFGMLLRNKIFNGTSSSFKRRVNVAELMPRHAP